MFEVHVSKHSLFRLKDTGRLSIVRISQAFTFFCLKMTVGCLWSTYPSIHFSLDEDTLKITVGCRLCACPSIRNKNSEDHSRLPDKHISKHSPSPGAGTLKITVGCPLCTNPSFRNKNLHTCWTPWSKRETRGLWARPPVLSPVPVQAVHSRACLNLHHSDIQGTAQKSPCVNTLFEATKKKTRFVTVWVPGQDTNGHNNRET